MCVCVRVCVRVRVLAPTRSRCDHIEMRSDLIEIVCIIEITITIDVSDVAARTILRSLIDDH